MARTASHIGENLPERDALAVLGRPDLSPPYTIHRGEGVRKGRVSIVRVKSPSGVEERQEDSTGFCTSVAGFAPPLDYA